MKPNRRLLLIIFLLSLSSLFCTTLPSGQLAGPIKDSERIATLDTIREVVENSTLPDGKLDRASLVAYLKKDSHFEGAGEAPDGSVWARFQDSRLVIVPPPIPEPADEQTSMAPSVGPSSPAWIDSPLAAPTQSATAGVEGSKVLFSPRLQGGTQYNLPASDDAIVMNTLGLGFADASLVISSWLNEMGYHSRDVTPTVENLKTVQNIGVFYFSTHGGQGCSGTFEACEARYTPVAPPAKTPGAPATALPPQVVNFTYALWTATPVSEASDAIYKADLDGGFLTYMLADRGGDPDSPMKVNLEWHYGATGKFVSTYMHFSDDSLVFIDACTSVIMMNDFQATNASGYAGWDSPTTPLDRSRFFFDRLLGINMPTYERVPKAEPPNRPFTANLVYMKMANTGMDRVTTKDGGSKLYYFQLGGSFAILRPTISYLTVKEADNEMEINGYFGSEQGKVTIDGTEVAVQEWKSEKIRVTLPGADEAGGAGDVIVKVRDHESNAVPLTLWHVKFTYTEGPEQTITAYQHLYLDLYWRADVHRYRDNPDDTQFHDREPVTLETADASSGSWDCTWDGSWGVISFKTITGEGELPFTRELGAVGYTASAEIDPDEHTISHLDVELAFDDENTCIVETSGPGAPPFETASGFVLLPSLLDEVSPDYPVTGPLKLDDQWTLTRANRDLNHDGMWPWLKWEDIKPEHAPDPKETEA